VAAEGQVGARLTLIGKAAFLGGMKEATAAVTRANAEMAASTKASTDSQLKGYATLAEAQAAYRAKFAQGAAADTAALASVGKKALIAYGAVAAVVSIESLKVASNFQMLTTRLHTQAGVSVRAMNRVATAARNMSSALGTTPEAFVNAAYHPLSTGLGAGRSISITANAAKLSAMSGSNLDDTTNSVTSAVKIFGGSPTRAAAVLNAIVGSGNMKFPDLNAAIATGFLATGKTFGIGLKSSGAALAYMTDRGVPAAQAATHLRMTEALLGAPTQEAERFLGAAGFSQTSARDRTNAMAQLL